MPSEPKREKPIAVQQSEIEQRALASDFAAVFGQPRTRSPAQSRVLAHLAKHASDERNSYDFNSAKDGITLIAAGIHRDGAKSVLRVIDRHLSIAANVRPAKAEKPKVLR